MNIIVYTNERKIIINLKNMIRKSLILSTVFFVFSLITPSAFSQDKTTENKNNKKQECSIKDLTVEQSSKIETIKSNSLKLTTSLKADLKIKEAELDKLLIANEPDRKQIDNKINEIGNIKTSIRKEVINKRLNIRQELNADQKAQFDKKQCCKHHHGKRHHKRHKDCK